MVAEKDSGRRCRRRWTAGSGSRRESRKLRPKRLRIRGDYCDGERQTKAANTVVIDMRGCRCELEHQTKAANAAVRKAKRKRQAPL